MKIKKVILLSIVACFCFSAKAQRYLPGQEGIQISGGVVDGFHLSGEKGFSTDVAFSHYNQNRSHWVFGVSYLQKDKKYTPLNPYSHLNSSLNFVPISQFAVSADYLHNICDIKKISFFNVGFGAMGGYETINWGKQDLEDGATIMTPDRFLYGGNVQFEVESYLNDYVVLLLNAKERILFGSRSGTFHTQISMGVKFIIN